jgi:hypothetical protein
MSNFDADAFMTTTVDQPLETKFKLVPEGEYRAMIGDFDSTAIEQIDFEYKKGDRAGQPGTMTKFTCPFVIDNDPRVMQELGRDKATVTRQIILDMADSGGLDFGPNKNVPLGQIRAAVDQNQPGPWSIGNLRGAGPVMVKVSHRKGKRSDGSDFEMAEVTRVVKVT